MLFVISTQSSFTVGACNYCEIIMQSHRANWKVYDKQTEAALVTIFALIVKLTNGLGTIEGIRVKLLIQTGI